MKQTNNAIKFLMAQYRAIFKNANIAMVAAMAAAALAAGSANAADLSSKLTNSVDTAVDVTSNAADDTITVAGNNYAKSVTVNKGAKLTVSGHLAAVGDVTVNGGTLILKDATSSLMLGAIKDVSGSIMNKQHYEHNLKVTAGSDIQMNSANIGVANFDIAGSTISLKSGGDGGTNLTAYGAGAYQNDAQPANLSYNAVGKLTDVKATLEGGTNITAIGHLDIKGSAQDKSVINLKGLQSGGTPSHTTDLAYLGGSKKLTIDNTTINVKEGTDKTQSKGTAVVSPDLQITNSKIVIAAANDTLTLGGLADRNSVGGTSGLKAEDYTADTATIKNSNISITGGTLNLGHEAGDLQTKTSFNLTGNTIDNKGVINAYGNVTVDTVAGLYGANGTLNLSGSTLTVTGAQAIDLSDTNAKIKADAGSTFKAENANVTIGNGFESKVPKLVAGTLTVKGEVSAAPDASYQNRPFLVIQSGDVTALNEVKGSPKNTEIAVYNKTSGGSATLTLGNAQTTNGKLTDIARVYVGVGQDGKDSTNTLYVNGEWDFANAKLAVGNNGTLNINEGAEVSNIERLQIHGNNVAAKNTINIDGTLNVQRLLAAESQTTGGDEINVKGTFNITGDGKTETKGESGKYANDVQLTKATLNIKAGGTVSLANKDAWDDVLKVTTNSDTDITTFEVQATGGNTTDFGGWDKSKVKINAGGTLCIDLSGYTVADKTALDTLAGALKADSNGLIDFGGLSIGKVDKNNDGTIELDNMPTVKTKDTQNLEVNLGRETTLNQSYSMGSANVSGNSLTIGTGSTVEFNKAKNGKFANNTADAGSKVNVTLAANSAVNLNGDGSLGDIKKSGDGTAVVLGGKNGTQTVGVVDVAIFNQVGGNVTTTGTITATDIDVNGVLKAGGDVTTTTLNIAGGAINAAGKDITVSGSTEAKIFGDVEASSLSLSGGALIAGGADVKLDSLTGANNTNIQVGEDREGGLGATVTTTNLVLNGGSIFVDPEFGTPAGFVVTENLSNAGSTTSGSGTLDGKAYVGKNAALGIGFAKTDAGLAELKALVAPYLVDNGGFAENGVKNALVINDSVNVASGNGFVVDHELTSDNYKNNKPENKIVLGAGAALVVTDKALDEGASAAITFANTTASLTAGDRAKVVLVGDFTAADKGQKIFAADNGNADVTGTVDVVAAGGLLVGKINNGSIASLNLDPDAEKAIRSEVSAPVGQLFVDFANGKFDGATGAGYDFLATTISAKGYKAIDAAAHAATYAGAQQAAVVSVTTMADAMFGRVGAVGVEAASIAATGSQTNGGVWLTPMYKSMDADGFNAEGVSYGSDVDAAGVAFGADTVNGNMRFGAVFNIGSGDAEGKGQGNGLKDEFDYYGFGIYSAMGFGNFALVGDASMTVVSHDVQGLGLRGKADTTAVTMGLTGQYTVSTPMVDVTPHLGARFIRLNTDSYDLVGADGAIATTDFDVQNVFSVPLGVTLSKGFTTGGWTLAPSADLTITFNGGDTEAKSSTTFTGIKAINMNTEVLDEVQYGVTLGLGAQNGAFGTSFGINYTGSSNTDSFGVNAQARYMF